jgi:hypothetical protein
MTQAPAPQVEARPFEVMTWNIGGDALSASAPLDFTAQDKTVAVDAEILRWKPHVVALQETCDGDISHRLKEQYSEVGRAPSHSGQSRLLVRKPLEWSRVDVLAPFIAAEVNVDGQAVLFLSGHLEPAKGRVTERCRVFTKVLKDVALFSLTASCLGQLCLCWCCDWVYAALSFLWVIGCLSIVE